MATKRIPRTCECCGKGFDLPQWKLKGNRGKYCSRACKDASNYPPIEERFWAKVNRTETCWLWSGATDTCGYGVIDGNLDGKSKKHTTHKVSYVLAFGPVPAGLHVLHRCDTPNCVRAKCGVPGCEHLRESEDCESHLFLGTHADNMKDMSEKKRGRNQYMKPRRGIPALF
jgi:hypothetical protein